MTNHPTRLPCSILLLSALTACGVGGGGPEPSLDACKSPKPEGANVAYVVNGGDVLCTTIDAYLRDANGGQSLQGNARNGTYNQAQFSLRSGTPIAVGSTMTGTRLENESVDNPPASIMTPGTFCPVAGTITITAYTLDGTTGTVSGTVTGEMDIVCDSPEVARTWVPVKLVFKDVPVQKLSI